MATTRVGRLSHSNPVTVQAGERYAIAWTGQSYVYGDSADGELSTSQPYSNVRGVNATSPHGSQTPALVPLVTVSGREDLLCGSTNQMARMQGASGVQDFIVHHRAIGGSYLSQLEQGSGSYSSQIGQVADVVTQASPDDVVYVALCLQHGYTDETGNTNRADSTPDIPWATYEAGVVQMLEDSRNDIATATGQTYRFPLFIPQLSFWQSSPGGAIDAGYALEMLRVGTTVGDVYCVGPTYQYELGLDGLHLTQEGYLAHAEHWGAVMHEVLFSGSRWKPLYPLRATISGNTVVIRYFIPSVAFGHHPAGQSYLALDTTAYGWRGPVGDGTTHGYSYVENVGSARSVTGVSLGTEYPDATADVIVTLDGAPEVGARINHLTPSGAPPSSHATGNLRDRYDVTSGSGTPLYNWACVSSTVIE